MAPILFTILNEKPVNRNDNLRKIASVLGLSPPRGHTKAQLQQAIELYVRDEPAFEQKVRDMADEIKRDHLQIKCATEPIIPPPNDQETHYHNTQLDLFGDEIQTNSVNTDNNSKTDDSSINVDCSNNANSTTSVINVNNVTIAVSDVSGCTNSDEVTNSDDRTNSDGGTNSDGITDNNDCKNINEIVQSRDTGNNEITIDLDQTCSMETDQSNNEPSGQKFIKMPNLLTNNSS